MNALHIALVVLTRLIATIANRAITLTMMKATELSAPHATDHAKNAAHMSPTIVPNAATAFILRNQAYMDIANVALQTIARTAAIQTKSVHNAYQAFTLLMTKNVSHAIHHAKNAQAPKAKSAQNVQKDQMITHQAKASIIAAHATHIAQFAKIQKSALSAKKAST